MSNKNRKKKVLPQNADTEASRIHQEEIGLPERLPILAIDNSVLFPFMIAPVVVTHDRDIALINDVLRGDRLIGVFMKKSPASPDSFQNIHAVGSLAVVLKMLRMPDGALRLLLHGLDRIRITEEIAEVNYMEAKAEILRSENKESRKIEALIRNLKKIMTRIVEIGQMPADLEASVAQMEDPGKLADLIISHLTVKESERQEILATYDLEARLARVLEIVSREAQVLELGSEIQTKVSTRMEKNQRDYMLREEMKAIKKELGEDGAQNPDILELSARIDKAELPEYADKAARKELSRLEMIPTSSPEYAVGRNYLDCILSLPWTERTQDNIDIKHAAEVLDEDHFGLEDVKERILEYLAVIQLKQQIRGPILCLVGPPGVGKTSLGRSIARAMGRKFQRMSLGGMRDEAEIRGHRRTYIGSMPGRVLKSMRDCGVNNPLIMLDEIDKLGADFRGDPAAALLEVLDPEQNNSFTDHYLDMPYDLSAVMFVTTANNLDSIPGPLLDRMEVLTLSGYTASEKLEISKRYLVPRAYENTGVTEKEVVFTDEGISEVINGYTSEAGVRNIEREINNICRKAAKQVAMGESELITVDPPKARNMLGPWRVFTETVKRASVPGVAVGLAWTPYGGKILFLEATALPGAGSPMLTGHLGSVMKESATTAHSYLQSNAQALGIPEEFFSEKHLHLHVPAGATPKDGPSAGVAILCTLCSLLIDTPIKERLAMTGEVTLKGNVLPVGGIKEKVLAAHQAGILEVILPARSRDTFNKDIPKEIVDSMRFYFVDTAMEALRIAFPKKVFSVSNVEAKPVAAPPAPPTPQPKAAEVVRVPHKKTTEVSRGAKKNEYRGYRADETEPDRRNTVVLPPPEGKDNEPRSPLRIEPDPSKKPRRRRHPRGKDTRYKEDVKIPAKDEEVKKQETLTDTEKPLAASNPSDHQDDKPTGEEEVRKSKRRRRGRRGGAGRNRTDRTDQTTAAQDGAQAKTDEQKPATPSAAKPGSEKRDAPKHEKRAVSPARSERSAERKPREESRKAEEKPKAQPSEQPPAKPVAQKFADKTNERSEQQPKVEPTKPAAKRPVKKTAAKRTTAKKTVAKKTTAKTTAKKTTAKTAAKKTAVKKTTTKKTAVKKTAAKSTAKKTAVKKTTAKKTAVKKTAAKKTTKE